MPNCANAVLDPSIGFSANKLLSELGTEALERIRPNAAVITVNVGDVLYKAEQRIQDVYFPLTAVICHLTIMEDGDSIESGTVGCEGATWISASFGAPSMPCQTVVAIAGECVRIAVQALDEENKHNGKFRNVLMQYSHALLIHAMRSAACNGLHELTPRCARWMLTTLDRTDEDKFAVTHEFLASLLGARRTSVTQVLGTLHAAGVLDTRRGTVRIVNRKKLEEITCECYFIIKDNYKKVGRM